MAYSHKTAVCFSARFAAFVAVTTGVFGACAAWPQTARAQAVFDGEKRAKDNEIREGEGEITGRVLLDDGKPASGFVVRADFSQGHTLSPGEGSAVTDAQGNYRIHGLIVWEEPFRVKVDNYRTGYIAEPARLIYVNLFPKQKADNVNFTLRRGPQITVRVRDAETGEPVAGIAVADEEDRIVYSRGEVGKTDANGELTFRADDLEVDLFLDEHMVYAQKRTFAPGYSGFKRIRLPKIADTVVNIKTYKDPTGYPWVTFRGIVVDAKNKPVPGATVRLLRDGQSETTSDAEGRFSFRASRVNGLRAGVITVEKGSSSVTIYPTAEQTWGTMLLRLNPAVKKSEIKGQAVSAAGKPLSGIPIDISSRVPDPMNAGRSFLYLPREYRGVTDASGYFSIKGLPEEASYRIEFRGSPTFERDEAGAKPHLPPVPYPDNWIQLKEGETHDTGRISLYPAGAVIIGHVVSPPDIPFRQLLIVVQGEHLRSSMTVDEDGNFRFPNVTRESVKLNVNRVSGNGFGSNTQGDNPGTLYQGIIQAGKTNVTLDLRNVGSEKAVLVSAP